MSDQAKPKKLITLMQLCKIILILSLVMWLPVSQANAVSIHYELDKSYYYPGDSGELILAVDRGSSVCVYQAFMEIKGIGKFEWETTGFTEVPNLPPGVHAYLLTKGQTIKIPFKIPSDTKPGIYGYAWTIVEGPGENPGPEGSPRSGSDTLKVLAVGEAPPSSSPSSSFPCLLIAILLVAIPILIILIIFILIKKIVKKKKDLSSSSEKPINRKEIVSPSRIEIYIRKILGILILISTLPFAIYFAIGTTGLSLLSILTIVVIFGVYLLRNKGYHLKTDLIFVLVGLVAYVLPIPIFVGFFAPPVAPLTTLKGFFLTADWANEGVGMGHPYEYLFLCIINILFFSSGLFLFITDIFSKIKAVVNSKKRELIASLAFLAIFGTIFTLPWLHEIQIGMGGMGAGGPGPNSGIILELKLPPENTTTYFDTEKDAWVYQIELINTHGVDAEIIGLKGKDMAGKTVQIAPPFGDNIEIIGGNKTFNNITIAPTIVAGPPEPGKPPKSKPALLRIYSRDPLLLIT